MKRIVLLLSCIFALLFVIPMANDDFATKADATNVVVTGNGVRLRYGPSLSADIYCKVNKGQRLTYYSTCGDWYCVGYNGQTLYISRDFSSLQNTDSGGSRVYTFAAVHATNLRLRTGPGTNYPYFVWTATGQTVHVNYGDNLPYLGVTKNGFYKVTYQGKICWICAKYATLY